MARISRIETLRNIMIDFCRAAARMSMTQLPHAAPQFGLLREAAMRQNGFIQRVGDIEALLARAVHRHCAL